jgi:hypothetical protein
MWARECRVGQTDASAVHIDPGNWRTFAGFDDNSDCAGRLASDKEPQRLGKVAADGISRAKHFSCGDFRSGCGHFENCVRASWRQDSTPRSNPATNRQHSSRLVEHDQIQGKSYQTRVN